MSAEFFADGWLRTGDLGFLRDGRLCVTGRHKDVLFLNGRTLHAPDMEEVAAATPGLPHGTCAVVGSTDPSTGAERVVVFVAWARPPREAAEVLGRVAARVREALLHASGAGVPLVRGTVDAPTGLAYWAAAEAAGTRAAPLRLGTRAVDPAALGSFPGTGGARRCRGVQQ